MIISSSILAIFGICVSTYAYFLEQKIKTNKNYVPFCDISDKVSCSKVITSKYATFFAISNSVWGIIFYSAVITASFFDLYKTVFALSIFGFGGSIVLASILYFIIRTACLLCTSIYIINILLLITSYYLI